MKQIACYVEATCDNHKILAQIDQISAWVNAKNYPRDSMTYHPFFIEEQHRLNKDEFEGMLSYIKEGKVDRVVSLDFPNIEKNANWTIFLLTCKNSGIPVELVGIGEVEVNHNVLRTLEAML